ncbi:gamma-aminobutyraldehyde dehydrogenase [Nocardia transvalensis]|nr:gamma-aminobutyraldehyde dehydrogenase [Nocardia transvalensis]
MDGRPVSPDGVPTSAIENPADGTTYARAPLSGREQVDDAMNAAHRAFAHWKRTTPADRQRILLELTTALTRQADDLIGLECRDTGKPMTMMREAEWTQVLDQIPFLAGAARCLNGLAAGEYLDGHCSYIRREPLGVCAQMAPWNYPLLMAVWKSIPAIAAGNTVVLKPSELTPVSAIRFAEIAAEHLPPGVLNVVCGDRDTGRCMVEHPIPAMVSLTGSVRAGREVAATAALGIKRVHLELGGKAPVVVFDDADVDRAAAGIAEAGYFNAGQDCAAATRVLVASSVHDEFVAALAECAEAIVVGPPDRTEATCGPLISAGQRQRVEGFLERLPEHARVHTGGSRVGRTGHFFAPSIVTGVRHTDEIARAEVFGPVITVERFTEEDDVIEKANGVEYGLTSSVWTRNHGRALRMSAALDFGCVWINTHMPLPAEMPHGGFKKSGYGKDMSIYALEDYTWIKHVMSDVRV